MPDSASLVPMGVTLSPSLLTMGVAFRTTLITVNLSLIATRLTAFHPNRRLNYVRLARQA